MFNKFLPVCQEDLNERGWDRLDFLFISGDAYVDHPSFGPAIICRLLEKHGYRVGIIAQPNWRNTDDFIKMGRPRYGVFVSAGNLDSMLNKFTAAKKSRSSDSYSPGGQSGLRPERATLVYCSRIRELWKKTPLIIGGIEASLRRFAHYDYWSNSVRRSILIDSMADLLIYGMGEKQILEVAAKLSAGIKISEICDVKGTCWLAASQNYSQDSLEIPSYQEVSTNNEAFASAVKMQYWEQDPVRGKCVVQDHGAKYLVQNPPAEPLSSDEMDEIYELPYQRTWHPMYNSAGGVPAIQEVKFSLVSHRGCFGACSFCAIVSHQGRIIQNRSHESLLKEAEIISKLPDFKGYIHDVGGPTANFRHLACNRQKKQGACKNRQCLFPSPCKNLNTDHTDYLSLLRKIRVLPGIKKVFIRSGLRYDYLMSGNNTEFLAELCQYHVSGQLKVAPEHVSSSVLNLMGKSEKDIYLRFAKAFQHATQKCGKEQYLVPYFMSSHPGAELKDAIELAEFIRDLNYYPQQVQDFIPTPGSLSTCMYYTGINPLNGKKVYVARDMHAKQLQRALLQYRNPANYQFVYEALKKAGRMDLVGFGTNCLIRPPKTTRFSQEKDDSKTNDKGSNTKNKKTRRLNTARNKKFK